MYLNRVFTRIFSYFKETLIYGYEYVFSKFILWDDTHTHAHAQEIQLHTNSYKLSVKKYTSYIKCSLTHTSYIYIYYRHKMYDTHLKLFFYVKWTLIYD